MKRKKLQDELISIVVPVYNSEMYIIRVLDSLRKQSYENFEVIIVDGSTDNTGEIIDGYINGDSRFVYYSVANQGPGFARNYGICRASGVFITFMDHDDFVHEDWLLELYNVISEYKVDIALNSGFYNVYSDDSVEKFQTEVCSGVYLLNHDIRVRMSHGWIAPWFKLISLDFIKEHSITFSLCNKFDDVLFHFRAIHYAASVAFSDKLMYYHRMHRRCVTSSALENRDMYFYHFKTLYDILDKNESMQLAKTFLPFMKNYTTRVASKEKYFALYNKIVISIADENIDRAKTIAALGVEHAKLKCK